MNPEFSHAGNQVIIMPSTSRTPGTHRIPSPRGHRRPRRHPQPHPHRLRRALRRWLALGGAVLTAATLTVALPAAVAEAAPSTWSAEPTVNQGATGNYLNAVSCGSATDCMAVGSYTDSSGNDKTLAEAWNGDSWSVLTTPDPGATGNQFNDVSCVSATDCEAVGSYVTGTDAIDIVIAKWNGSTWTTQTSPDPGTAENDLIGVSCLSASSCQAVGHYDNGTTDVSLVESWNGSTWSVVSSPSKGSFTYLNDVSCVSAANCMAVGRYLGNGSFTLTEKWNGTKWSIVSSPNAGGHNDSELLRVSCATASSCIAVGDFSNGTATETLAEKWNGSTWTHPTTPNPSGSENNFDGVSCASATSCVATGDDRGSSGDVTLAEKWNGTSWSVTSTPSPGSSDNILLGVACTTTTTCRAVGDYTPAGAEQTLAEKFSGGTWSVAGSANENTAFNTLTAVSCHATDNCMAAGSYQNSSGTDQTLTESWDGSTWSVVPSADQGSGSNTLAGISCGGAARCMAVGAYANGAVNATLAEVWNGSTWTATTTQNPGDEGNRFAGVSCRSATSCVAVGDQVNSSGADGTLAEIWNGSTWSVLTTPDPGTGANYFNGVSCASASFCVAVGGQVSGAVTKPLTATWNGTTWKTTTSANPTGTDNVLFGVSCPSATSCQAVGQYLKSSSSELALIESWNGTKWSLATTPDPSPADDSLEGVSCFSAANCVAVGSYSDGAASVTFADSWNGLSWLVFNPSNPGAWNNELGGVSCPSATICQAAGHFAPDQGVPSQTLAEIAITQAPVIKSFSPTSGKPGSTVTITGEHFGGVTKVTFDGTSATITSISATQVKATVPAGAKTGRIKVTSPGGTATSTTNFTVT